MRSAPRVLRLPLVLMGAVVLLTYGAIVWTLRRGFDWTDEAFIYTMIASNRTATGEPWGFQHLLHPLYALTGESVLAFRLLRLAGYVLLSAGLVGCARVAAHRIGIRVPRSGWVFVLLFAQVGTFLAWSYPTHALGYNELASWLAQLGAALVVLAVALGVSAPEASASGQQPTPTQTPTPTHTERGATSRDQRDRRAHRERRLAWTLWAGLGGLATLLVFTKVTSGVALWGLVALALVVPNPGLRLPMRVVAVVAGAITVLTALWAGRYPVVSYLRDASALALDKSALDAFDHPFSEMLAIYSRSMLYTGRVLIPALSLFALVMAAVRRPARLTDDAGRRGPRDVIVWTLGALLLASIMVLPRMVASAPMSKPQMWSYVGVLAVFVGAAGMIGLAILGADGARLHGSAVTRSLAVAVAGLAIVAGPFISAVGTNNRLAGELSYAATLWAVVLGTALVRLTQRATVLQSSARILPALTGFVVVLMAGLAVRADIEKPYRTPPLLSQGTSTSVPELRGILLTRNEAAWVDWVAAAGDSLGAQGVPATAVDAPGALFAFNHSGYANPWLAHLAPVTVASLRHACTASPPADLFVLQPGTQPASSPSTAGVARSLAGCGLAFPGDFRVADRRASTRPKHSMTIWRLRNGQVAAQGAAR